MVGDPAGKMIAQAVATAESSPLWRGRQRSRYNTSPCNFVTPLTLLTFAKPQITIPFTKAVSAEVVDLGEVSVSLWA
jgi:hypothetical protein